ncbi:MAG: DNA mismatch repair endonuclease MutL [Deltaproteobacteria bacterium]|nr:DNA mismatch repair endonuclease MutL [Deltaproteobacteria bacterium]
MKSLPSIALLPPDVANQIAAGEVVERPASIVKELVENSLDAGARTITVSVDGGGLARLSVTDDGGGMNREDLALSVVRHATSKIRSAEDLFGVASYGFRGEALASIGSVSRLTLTSRTADADEGWEVRLEGNASPQVRPVGCAVGTTVTIEDLFFNTPARRKFLRTVQTEWAACADVVARLALPRPNVRFVLRKDGKTLREYLRRDTIAERVQELWSDDTLTSIDGYRGSVRVQAFLGPPERARSGTAGIAVYVNQRFVKDKLLLRAISQAYGSTLDGGRYPPGAMLIEVPAAQLDVNVHPQKAEVRFAQQNEVFSAVLTLLRDGLATAPWARSLVGAPTERARDDGWDARFSGVPYAPAPTHAPRPYNLLPSDLGETRPLFERPRAESTDAETPERSVITAASETADEVDPWGLAGASIALRALPTPDTSVVPAPEDAEREYSVYSPAVSLPSDVGLPERTTFASLRFVAQVRRMFFVCETDWGLVMLDQHAAAERLVFDRLRRAYALRDVRVQPLLVHETLEASAREVALAEEHRAALESIGFELTPIGPNTLAVRAVPALLVRADPRRLARDVLAEFARQGSDFSRALDLVLATMACHGSIRAGDDVAPEEARALLASLDDCDFGGHCPHGRPVVWSMKWSELERKVGR